MPFWKKKPSSAVSPSVPTHWTGVPASAAPAAPAPVAPQQSPFARRGDELFNQSDYANAAFMYSEALREDGKSAHLYAQLALAQTLSTPPQLDQALSNLNASIQIDPSQGYVWKLKGDVHQRKQQFDAAQQALSRAIPLLPPHEKVQAQAALGQLRSSRAAATTSVGISSSSPPASNLQAPLPVTPSSAHSTSPTTAPSAPVNSRLSASSPGATLSPGTPTAGVARASVTPPPPQRQTAQHPSVQQQNEALASDLGIPSEAPPLYSPPAGQLPSLNAGASLDQMLAATTTAMTEKRKGSLYLLPITAAGQIDSVYMLFWGKTATQSLLLDIPPRPAQHASWKKYYSSSVDFPGTTMLDHDCETAASYDGFDLGTSTVIGYTEEYREYQLAAKPQLQLFFEANIVPPVLAIDLVIPKLQALQRNPSLEDNAGLNKLLGHDAARVQTTKTAIEDLCMSFHRGQYDEPTRFLDFLTTESFTKHLFGGGGIGLSKFLFNILLGAELSIRLRKLGTAERYPNVMKPSTSALVIISTYWMENVAIRPTDNRRYTLIALNHQSQSEGLIRFAEAIQWPYLDEARAYLETAYSKFTANPSEVPDYLKDWLFGLVLPGKQFRQRILSCLVLASPTCKHLGQAWYYTSGLVVDKKSYWPKRSVLGRVLSSLPGVSSNCGWIGPIAAPEGVAQGWYMPNTRKATFPIPVVNDGTETELERLGFSEMQVSIDPNMVVRELTDPNKWNPPVALPRRTRSTLGSPSANATSTVLFKGFRLAEVATAGGIKQYRVTVDFHVQGSLVSFTLYSNPVFVHVPRCEGSAHPIHERMVEKAFKNIVLAKDLKNRNVTIPSRGLIIIDATEPGEEAMARAWCAETARHAVVRKHGRGCFTCATNLAQTQTGLAFNVLIWC